MLMLTLLCSTGYFSHAFFMKNPTQWSRTSPSEKKIIGTEPNRKGVLASTRISRDDDSKRLIKSRDTESTRNDSSLRLKPRSRSLDDVSLPSQTQTRQSFFDRGASMSRSKEAEDVRRSDKPLSREDIKRMKEGIDRSKITSTPAPLPPKQTEGALDTQADLREALKIQRARAIGKSLDDVVKESKEIKKTKNSAIPEAPPLPELKVSGGKPSRALTSEDLAKKVKDRESKLEAQKEFMDTSKDEIKEKAKALKQKRKETDAFADVEAKREQETKTRMREVYGLSSQEKLGESKNKQKMSTAKKIGIGAGLVGAGAAAGALAGIGGMIAVEHLGRPTGIQEGKEQIEEQVPDVTTSAGGADVSPGGIEIMTPVEPPTK